MSGGAPLERVGADTGGTFTDVVAADGRVAKVPSTPGDPGRAVRDGVRAVAGGAGGGGGGADPSGSDGDRPGPDGSVATSGGRGAASADVGERGTPSGGPPDGPERPGGPERPAGPERSGGAERSAGPERPGVLAHGTTVATNALLERRGARVALVATGGLGDVIEIGRQDRPSLYDPFADRPEPLVARSDRHEVGGRLDAGGSEVAPIDLDALDALVATLSARAPRSRALGDHRRALTAPEALVADDQGEHADDAPRSRAVGDHRRALTAPERGERPAGPGDGSVEAVAVCLLHADLDPVHERRVAAELRAAGLDVTCSHEVSPQFREYERTVTTAVNAYLRPPCRAYLRGLADAADEVLVMTSAGGLVPVDEAADLPASLLLSGPAGGVAAAAAIARACGHPDAVTFDMGGTSTDVCLVRGGEAEPAGERTVAGLPVRMPALDVHTIGAGGGSIAAIDAGGALTVGPRSAGAVPGPACYGLGGTAPTVTDADLVAGRLPDDVELPGLGRVDLQAAVAALERAGVEAEGVIRVVEAAMEQAVRTVTVARGVDPRGLALVAFGGAGPLHACGLADALGMATVIVPPRAGVLSAVGLLCGARQHDAVRSWPTPSDHAGLDDALAELADGAVAALRGGGSGAAVPSADRPDGAGPGAARPEGAGPGHADPAGAGSAGGVPDHGGPADAGPAHAGAAPLGGTGSAGSGSDDSDPAGADIEVEVELDCRYAGQSHELRVPSIEAFAAEHERRNGYARPGTPVEVVALRATARRRPVIRVEDLPAPDRRAAEGPAVLAEADCTVYVAPGWRAEPGPLGALVLTRSEP